MKQHYRKQQIRTINAGVAKLPLHLLKIMARKSAQIAKMT